MKIGALALVAVLATAGCLVRHLTMDIPPPGGCDRCHREKIAADWAVAITPVPLGTERRAPEEQEVVLQQLQLVPAHREVPSKKLSVFAASAPPEAIGDGETGIQCFVCHRSPGPPHEEVRGRFPHPWGGKSPPAGE